MRLICALGGVVVILSILVDAFETVLQPRRVTHRFRFARLFYRTAWRIWRRLAAIFPTDKAHEAFLSSFGPISLLGLFALWFTGLIFGFAVLHWSIGTPLLHPDSRISFSTYVYLSGTTFFTLGYGDITPISAIGRTLAVVESG